MTSDFYQYIFSNAESLYERLNHSADTNECLESLSFETLLSWQKSIGDNGWLISDRLKNFKVRHKHPELFKKEDWQAVFRDAISLFQLFLESPNHQISKISKDSQVHHNGFYLPFLLYAKDRCKSSLNNINDGLSHSCLDDYIQQLEKRLQRLSEHCYYAYWKNLKEEKDAQGVAHSLFDFSNDLYIKHFKEFFLSFPVLAKALSLTSNRWIEILTNVLTRFAEDKEAILADFLIQRNAKISNLIIEGGLTQSSSGPTVFVYFQNGEKLVYKSRSSANEVFFNRCIEFLNVECGFDLKTVATIDKSEYSWQEFVDRQPCQNPNEVYDYYKRLGIIAAFIQLLSGRDYHYGNIIACGSQPLIIDHERLFDIFNRDRIFSFRNANILAGPHNKNIDNEDDLLGAFHSKAQMKITQIFHDEQNVLLMHEENQIWSGKNIPILDSNPINPTDYCSYILDGYIHGMRTMQKHIESMSGFLKRNVMDCSFDFRYVGRPSKQYVEMMYESLQANCMNNGKDRSIALDKVFANISPDSDKWKLRIKEAECFFLEEFLLPRFSFDEETWLEWGLSYQDGAKEMVLIILDENLEQLSSDDAVNEQIENLTNYLTPYV